MRLSHLFGFALTIAGGVSAQSARAPHPDEGRAFALDRIARSCLLPPKLSHEDYRECRVSECGPFGTVAGREYRYAPYCLLPPGEDRATRCGDSSFAARYHAARGLAVFALDSGSASARLLCQRADPEVGERDASPFPPPPEPTHACHCGQHP